MGTIKLTWYTESMRRGPKPKPKEEIQVNVGLKVPPPVKAELLEIVKTESRTKGDLARLFFMRGLEAYRADKSIMGAANLPDIAELNGDMGRLTQYLDKLPPECQQEIIKWAITARKATKTISGGPSTPRRKKTQRKTGNQ